MSARLLVAVLRAPDRATSLSGDQWTALLCAAKAERLCGTLACRVDGLPLPTEVAAILADARAEADREHVLALWEADRALRALAGANVPMVLLKGAAYAAAGLAAAQGRMVGDLDILVPRERLDDAERVLMAAGWEWVKPDPYDDGYYRQWMHELPPLIHRERDRMIDVHHTILPLTARPKPDSTAMLADAQPSAAGFLVLCAEDRLCHAAAHMLADGDLAGGLRNLWDVRCLIGDLRDTAALMARADHHGLTAIVARAMRLADAVYGTGDSGTLPFSDRLFLRRLLSRDGWGRDARRWTGLAFYIRSHLLRMPPHLLARHLWTKWRKGHRPV